MGMPICVEIVDDQATSEDIDHVFEYFRYVDEKFSTYKDTSEITAINKGILRREEYSEDMKEVFALSEDTKKETNGYFNIIASSGIIDPSGIVKGWSIFNAAKILEGRGCKEFYIDAGGDIEARGRYWKVGIRNPFKQEENIKVLHIKNRGVATSGTYIRGNHIYDPRNKHVPATEIVSITIIGPNIYEADRFATAAFAMGRRGIEFIDGLGGLEGYMINHEGMATMTKNFEQYTQEHV